MGSLPVKTDFPENMLVLYASALGRSWIIIEFSRASRRDTGRDAISADRMSEELGRSSTGSRVWRRITNLVLYELYLFIINVMVFMVL